MELKEYLKIIKKNSVIFWITWILVVIVAELVLIFEPQKYQISLPIGLSRTDSQLEESDYDYFYQLEANNLFGKEVVRWVNDSGAIKDAIDDLIGTEEAAKIKKTLIAEQLSSGFIKIQFLVDSPNNLGSTVDKIKSAIEQRVVALAPNKEKPWFKLVFGEVFIEKKQLPFWPINIFAVLIGFWVALFFALLRHYWQKL